MRRVCVESRPSGLQNPKIELTPTSGVNYLPLTALLPSKIFVRL